MVGCNQPKRDPVASKFGDRSLPGQIKMVMEACPMDREKAKQFVNRCLDKATDAELRAICTAAYHITK